MVFLLDSHKRERLDYKSRLLIDFFVQSQGSITHKGRILIGSLDFKGLHKVKPGLPAKIFLSSGVEKKVK